MNNQLKIKQIDITGEVSEITINRSYAILVLEKWLQVRGCSLEEEIKDNLLIKIMLPAKFESAMKVLKEGCDFNDETYFPLLTSTGMMKHEDEENSGKCNYIFIKAKFKSFETELMDIMSLGKVLELLEKQEPMYINKDIIARTSLALSDTTRVRFYNWIDRVVILKETTYKHIATYQTLNKDLLQEGKVELNPPAEYECEFSFSDGFGLGSPHLFDVISKTMGYKIDYAVTRLYAGLAGKGVLVRFDWNKYFDDKYTCDTDVFKKVDGKFYTKDMWDNWVNISDADIILNETQAKWAKLWDSMDDLKAHINKYSYYRDLNCDSIYIGRVNAKEPKEWTRCNYQLLNVLNLTPTELKQLAQYDIDTYKSMIDKKYDINMLRLNLGDYVKEDATIEELQANTKYHKLLQVDERYYGLAGAKRLIAKNINKRVEELCGGKFYIKGNYKTLGASPIDICNLIMTGKLEPTLVDKDCYVKGKFGAYTLSRNPIAGAHEIQKVNLVADKELDNYLDNNFTDEIIFMPISNICSLMSGCDLDGDEALCSNNEIIYNSVIDTVPFLNDEDGKKADKLPFTMDNMYYSILRGSGAIINKIATTICRINTLAQDIPFDFYKYGQHTQRYTYDLYKKKFKDEIDESIKKDKLYVKMLDKFNKEDLIAQNKELRKEIDILNSLDTIDEEDTKKIKKLWDTINNNKSTIKAIDNMAKQHTLRKFTKYMEDKSYKDLNTLSETELKALITERFEYYKPYVCLGVQLSMTAIDLPKTLIEPDKALIKLLNSCLVETHKDETIGNLKDYYPMFMGYVKDYAKKVDELNRCSLNQLDNYIEAELLKNLRNVTKKIENSKDSKIAKELLLDTITKDIETNTIDKELLDTMKKIKGKYLSACGKITGKSKAYVNKVWASLEKEINTLLEGYKDRADDIRYSCKMLNFPAGLIVNFFWEYLEPKLDYTNGTYYKEAPDGEIEYLHKRYRKESCSLGKLFE